MKWKKKNHWNGMELEWKYNGKQFDKWRGKINRWNGNGMENYIYCKILLEMEWNGNGMEMEIKWKIGIELNADLYFRQREILQKYWKNCSLV